MAFLPVEVFKVERMRPWSLAGQFGEAVTPCQADAAIFRRAGDEHNERIALSHLDEARASRQTQPGG